MKTNKTINFNHLLDYAFQELSPEMETKIEAHLDKNDDDAKVVDGILNFALHHKIKTKTAYKSAMEAQRQQTIIEVEKQQTINLTTDEQPTKTSTTQKWQWWLGFLFIIVGSSIAYHFLSSSSNYESIPNQLDNVPPTDVAKVLNDFYNTEKNLFSAGSLVTGNWEEDFAGKRLVEARQKLDAIIQKEERQGLSADEKIYYFSGMLHLLVQGGNPKLALKYLSRVDYYDPRRDDYSGLALAYAANEDKNSAKTELLRNPDAIQTYYSAEFLQSLGLR